MKSKAGAGKIARSCFAICLACVLLLNCMPSAFAANVPVATVKNGELKASMAARDGAGYLYIIEIPQGTAQTEQSISFALAVDSTFDTADYAPASLIPDGTGFSYGSVSYTFDDGQKGFSFTLKDVPLAPSATVVDPSLSENDQFSPWTTTSFYWISATLADDNYTYIDILVYEKASDPIDTTALQTAIANAPTEGYYKENDRYNGKTTAVELKKSDALKELALNEQAKDEFSDYFDAAYKIAQDTISNPVTQEQVEQAIAWLNITAENLIPAGQVNATELYEAIQDAERTEREEKTYSPASWTAYAAALAAAQDMAEPGGTLYDSEGAATEANGTTIRQEHVNERTETLKKAVGELALSYDSAYGRGVAASLNAIPVLYRLSESAMENEAYTQESRNALKEARTAANKTYGDLYAGREDLTASDYQRIQDDYQAMFDAYYLGLKNVSESITVSVRTADSLGLKKPDGALDGGTYGSTLWTPYYNSALTLTEDQTVAGLLTALGDRVTEDNLAVFINGVLACSWNTITSNDGFTDLRNPDGGESVDRTREYVLHDGDQVDVVRMPPGDGSYYGWPMKIVLLYAKDYVGLARFEDEKGEALPLDTLRVTEGEPFDLYVTRASSALDSYTGRRSPFTTATVYATPETSGSASVEQAGAPTQNTGFTTDGSGKVTVTLYGSGWQNLYAVDLREDNATVDAYQNTVINQLPTLVAGASLWVYVQPKTGNALTEALPARQAELDAYFSGLNQAMFDDAQWAQVTASYKEASAAISGAATLTDAKNAVADMKAETQELLTEIETAHQNTLTELRNYLAFLPTAAEAAEQLTQDDGDIVAALKTLYEDSAQYIRDQFTGLQKQQYDAIMEVWGEDGSTLPEHRTYTARIVFEPAEAQEAWETALDGGKIVPPTYYERAEGKVLGTNGLTTYNYTLEKNSDGEWTFQFNPSSQLGIAYGSDVGEAVTVGKQQYQIVSVVVEGGGTEVIRGEWRMGRFQTANGRFPRCDDVTYTITYTDLSAELTEAEKLEKAREEAKAALDKAYAAYDKAGYTNEGWSSLTDAYRSGLTAVAEAATEETITAVKQEALQAMEGVPKRPAADPGGDASVGNLGTVHVTFENRTYADGDFTGEFLQADIALNSDTTMMSAILTALDSAGYDWTGTGGTKGSNAYDDWAITYLSSIEKDGKRLAEFDGGPQSGWMGTLNDWFTNEGFASFTADAANANYRIVDGDQIAVQYTCDLGIDLGGGWGISDTSLKSISVTGGTLSPSFSGQTNAYTLTADGSAVSVLPVAVNKNYQVRTYINATSGDNWYRRGESLPVKAGDTISIGVGGQSWPSMNSNPGYQIAYDETWYTIKVVDSSSADAVNALIADLATVTYGNYQEQAAKAQLARTAYDALSAAARAQVTNLSKLTATEADVKKFEQIDAVKTLLAAVPAADKLTTSDQSKVRDARAAYDALTPEQQMYITLGDVAKYNAAVAWLEKQGIYTGGTIEKNEDEEAAAAVISLIDAIGTVTSDSGGKITAARKAYNALTANQKKLVSNYGVLTEAEAAYAKLTGDLPFTDVAGHWALEAIQYAYEKGLMDGVGNNAFNPNGTLNRAMLATLLYRMEGTPAVTGANPFEDVASGAWYTDAIIWASANGIVDGMGGGTFAPDASITREQMATMLYRYARYKKYDTTKANELTDFQDTGAVSTWAADALKWANAAELVNGRTRNLIVPGGTATRAEAATLLMRFLQTIAP